MKENFYWRSAFFLLGVIILSLGATLTIKGFKVGVGSWDVLHIGLTDTIGLTIGSWSIIVGLTILAIDSVILKHLPRIGTYLDMFLAGIFIDIFNFLLPDVDAFIGQIILYSLGIFLLGFGCGMYMIANFGVGPRDTLMLLMSEKLGWSMKKSRTTMEVTVAIAGFLLGGPIGIGTVLMAFCLGPIVQWSVRMNEKLFTRVTGGQKAVWS